MQYTATYRKPDGSTATETAEAKNREAAFAAFRAKGIEPMRVVEGGAASAASPAGKKRIIAFSAAVAAVAIVAICFFVFRNDGAAPQQTDDETAQRTSASGQPQRQKAKKSDESAPAATNTAEKSSAAKTSAPAAPKSSIPTYRDENGILRYQGGARVPNQRPSAPPVPVNPYDLPKFQNAAEDHIAMFLELKPGEPLLAGFEYDERFDAAFRASLTNEITVLPDDTPEMRKLKLDVIDVKKELRERMEAGEKPSKIMNDARAELVALGQYKMDIERELFKVRSNPDATEADIEDAVKAANILLEKKGLPPFRMGRLNRMKMLKERKNR